jgi:putative pyoverdin transport system ATP-binding/permease protein
MYIVGLLNEEARGQRGRVLAIATLAGIANGLLVAGANLFAESPEQADLRALLMFGLTMALYILGFRRTCHWTAALVEAALYRIRTRLVEKIERAELLGIERVRLHPRP